MENTETTKEITGIKTEVSGMKHRDNYFSVNIKVTLENHEQFVNTSSVAIGGQLRHETIYFGMTINDLYTMAKNIMDYANKLTEEETK